MASSSKRISVEVTGDASSAIAAFEETGAAADEAITEIEEGLDALGEKTARPKVTLDGDTDVEVRLDKIKAQLDELRGKVAAARVEVDGDAVAEGELSGLEASLERVSKRVASAKVDIVGVADSEAKLAVLDVKLAEFGRKDEKAKAEIETGDSEEKVSGLADAVKRLLGGGGGGGEGLGAVGPAAEAGGEGMSSMMMAALALSPTLVPIGAAAVAGLGGIVSLTAGGAAGLGAFALAAGGAATQFQTEAGKILASWQTAMQPFVKPVFADALKLVGPLLADLTPIVKASSTALDGIAKSMGSAINGREFKGFMSFLTSEAPFAIQTFATSLGNIGAGIAGIAEAFAPFSKVVGGGLDGMTASFARFGEGLSKSAGFKSFMDYVRENGPLIGQVLGTLGKDFLDLLVALAPVGVAFLKLVQAVEPLIAEAVLAVGIIGGGLAKAIDVLAPSLTKVSTEVAGVLTAFLRWVENAKNWEKVWKDVKDAVDDAWRDIDGVWRAMAKGAGDLGASVSGAWDSIKSTTASVWSDIMSFFTDTWSTIKTAFSDALDRVKTTMSDAWDAIKATTTRTWDAIKSFLDQAWATLKSTVSTVWADIERTFSTAWTKLKTTVSTGVGDVVAYLAALPRKAVVALAALAGDLGSVGSNAMTAMLNGIISAAVSMWAWLAALPTKVVNSIGNVGTLLLGIGEAMIAGLAQGIVDAAQSVYSAISSVVSHAIHLAHEIPIIHSPSVVFHDIGVNMMLGMANGINEGGATAAAAMTNAMLAVNAKAKQKAITFQFGGASIAGLSGSALSSITTTSGGSAPTQITYAPTNHWHVTGEVSQTTMNYVEGVLDQRDQALVRVLTRV